MADEAIAAALDARLTERKSRPAPNVVGPVDGPTEPQLIAVVATPFGKMASDQEELSGADDGVLFQDIADRCRKTYRTQPGLSLGRVKSPTGDHCCCCRRPLGGAGVCHLRGGSLLDL